MKTTNRTLTRIPADSYQIINNDDNSIDLLFSDKLMSELKIDLNSPIQIKNENIDNQSVMVIMCTK